MRPEPAFADKAVSKFRDYTIDPTDPLKERVQRTYREMHLNQTVDFVKGWYVCTGLLSVLCVEICTTIFVGNDLFFTKHFQILSEK